MIQLREQTQRRKMLRAGDRVGVAISGGADSVALLRLLLELRDELGIVISGVHFNHGLRGAESDADEDFVGELLRKHDLEFFVERSPAVGGAVASDALTGRGIEADARDLRYAFFGHLLRNGEVTRIATAHTLDDQAETVLLRMIRGTGVHGLRGILPSRSATGLREADSSEIVRPLLGVHRTEIEAYLRKLGQGWREDSSNQSMEFTRNRVRHELLPWLEEQFNPEIKQRLAELAEVALEEDAIILDTVLGYSIQNFWPRVVWAKWRLRFRS